LWVLLLPLALGKIERERGDRVRERDIHKLWVLLLPLPLGKIERERVESERERDRHSDKEKE
jgi:hypothetical protein